MTLLCKLKSNFKFYNKKIGDSASSLLFPSFCLECNMATDHVLCPACLNLLELVDPQIDSTPPPYVQKRSYCFEYVGPIQKVIGAFKYADRPYLASALASFLYIQFERLGWPTPDCITHVPQFFLRTKLRGYNQSEQLAIELAELMQLPHKSLLQKQETAFSQSILSKKGRKEFKESTIKLKNQAAIEDKTLLVIDDVYTTGATMENVAKALAMGYPKSIYVLTVACCNLEE